HRPLRCTCLLSGVKRNRGDHGTRELKKEIVRYTPTANQRPTGQQPNLLPPELPPDGHIYGKTKQETSKLESPFKPNLKGQNEKDGTGQYTPNRITKPLLYH